ncbi:MAG: hypothetical protein CO032_02550 [Nitrosopumilales archaeon CG_4_9_14_0_2_um_filter_34_16]|nr:MAG: hypothetical protein CO032_02550 [Nitrosopumilales archaeon CG_4_9_14_0_2_um_filter_34_16]
MTKIPKLTNAIFIANILKKSMKWQIHGYEKSILEKPDGHFTRLCRTLKEIEECKLKGMEKLIDFIKSEHKTNCKHTKKMQDTDPNGMVYCMKCGEDV